MRIEVNKNLLVTQLEHTRNNYILGLAALTTFSSPVSHPLLNSQTAQFGSYTVTFGQVVTLLENDRDRGILLREFLKMLMRTLIQESFEHIKDYCTLTDQYGSFKGQSWYEFSRMIRNFLSHNCRFEFNRYDRDRLPVVWKDKEITFALDRKSPDFGFFGQVETWEIFIEFETFVRDILK